MAGMIVGQFVSQDLDLSGAATFLDLFTKGGKEHAKTRFNQPTTEGLINIQLPIVSLRKRLRSEKTLEQNLVENLTKIAKAEEAIVEIINSDTQDKRISETVEQVYWKPDAMGNQLNVFGFLIEIILLWKTIIILNFPASMVG